MTDDALIISFEVPGEPVSWKRAVPIGRGRVAQDPAFIKHKSKVRRHAHVEMKGRAPVDVDVDVTAAFHFEEHARYAKADLDRHVNLVLDALEGEVYDNDRRVRSVHAWKEAGAGSSTVITVMRSKP